MFYLKYFYAILGYPYLMNKRKVFDTQILKLRACFQTLPDHRRDNNTQYEIEDAASAAFSVFFSQSPSFLAHQRLLEKKKGRSNLHSLFAVEKIPSDNQIRNLLDPLSPELLAPLFFDTIETLEAEGELEQYRGYDGRILISNDGTETVSSQKIDCPDMLSPFLAKWSYALFPLSDPASYRESRREACFASCPGIHNPAAGVRQTGL